MPSLPIDILNAQNRASGEYRGAVSGQVDLQSATSSFQQVLGAAARDHEIEKQEEVERIRRLELDEARTHVINAESRTQALLDERIGRAQRQDGGPIGATADVLKDLQTWTDTEINDAPTAAKAGVTQAMARLRGEATLRMGGLEIAARQKKLATDFIDGLDEDRRLVYANPQRYAQAVARREALSGSLDLPDATRLELAAKSRQELAGSAATSMAENTPQALLDRAGGGDPEKAAAAVKNDPILSNLTPEALRQTLHLARTEVQRRGAEGRFNVASKTEDVQAMVLNGVEVPAGFAPTAEDYTRAFGADGAAMWQQKVGNYLDISDVIRRMKTSTPLEREQMVEAQAPAAGAGFTGGLQKREAVLQAKRLIERKIIADPADYALTNSNRVRNAAAAMQTVFNDPKATGEDRAAVTEFFAEVMEAEQIRLGVDVIRDEETGNRPRGPKLLTNAQANALSDAFRNSSNGGPDAAALIQQLELRWQKRWPQVYSQLAADNKLPASALVIPNMPNDASRSRMAQVAAMKPDELKALVKPEDLTDIRLEVLKKFDAAQQTFIAQGGSGYRTLSIIVGEAEKLATWYRANGSSVNDAAAQAYRETMGHAYRFEGTYRVPNRFDSKEVQRGTAAAVDRLVREGGMRVFADGAPLIMAEDALRNRSIWITNSNESGLSLRLRGADGSVLAVHDKNGAPVNLTWAELQSSASEARVRDRTPEGNEEWLRRRQRELNPRRDGVLEPGNIDLTKRPVVRNGDGSISTVRSIGVNIDGQEVLIPTVSDDGRILSDKDAIAQYRRTGKHLGKFSSPQASDAYAQQLHLQQERMYSGPR